MNQHTTLTDDPFFRLTDDGTWNACIGPQGDEENYADGYMEAALYLSNVVIEKQLLQSRDTLVLPVLYNARHAIELALKYVTKQLNQAGLLPQPPQVNHAIQKHYELLRNITHKDRQLTELTHRLSPFVQSLAAIDADGQQLRYAQSKEGAISLQNRPLANLQVIYASLQELSNVLRLLRQRAHIWCEEHRTGTCTRHFSRSDLMSITIRLAKEPTLKGPNFERHAGYIKIRDELKEQYGVGNKPLEEAIQAIKKNREMGSLLGMEFTLKFLTDEKIKLISASWTKRYPPRTQGEPRTRIVKSSELPLEMRSFFEADTQEITEELLKVLSREEIVDWSTIFYLARDRYRCEDYDWLHEQHLRESQASDDLWAQVDHLINKTNLLSELVKGLRCPSLDLI